MTIQEAVKWLRNLMSDIASPPYEGLWPYEQALSETIAMLEAQEGIKTESDFITHIIGEICDFAVKNNAKPDDALENLAESILELLDVCSFNNWEQKKEGDPE